MSEEGVATASAAKPVDDPELNPWLHAWHDPVAGIKAWSSNTALVDLNGDGDAKFIVADMEKNLRVYKGELLITEVPLLDTPVGLSVFYSDSHVPRTPAIAVASGPYIFIYRNLRPFYKFTLPHLPIDPTEADLWAKIKDGAINADTAVENLVPLRDKGVKLTRRSMELIHIEDPVRRVEFVDSVKGSNLVQNSVVTCMDTLNKSFDEPDSVSCLVIGTESGSIYILDPSATSILKELKVKDVPVFVSVSGKYDVEYRIIVACRDSKLYTIKNGEVTGSVIELESPCNSLIRVKQMKSILVSCMGNVIHSYHIKGNKNWSIYLPCGVSDMKFMDLPNANVEAILVALDNGEVRMYNGKKLIHTLYTGDTVTSMRFGSYGREANTLLCTHKSGALTIKMMKRKVNIEKLSSTSHGPPAEQDIPLNIPKKTKLYVEQTQREREQASEMHRVFQRDLCKLRLLTAKSYVKIITDGNGPMSYANTASIRLNAQVQGLGPKFRIVLNVQNTGKKSVTDIPVTYSWNENLYKIAKPILVIPLLIPGLMYQFYVNVDCVNENGGSDAINIYVLSKSSCVPIITAVVNMPISELNLLDA